MNEHDSGKMSKLLDSHGYVQASEMDQADIVIFNTCTIREKAYHKAESEIGKSEQFKTRRNALIGVCGCVAQQEGLALKQRFDHVDFIFGPDQLAKLPMLIDEAKKGISSAVVGFIDDPDSPEYPHNISESKIKGGSAFVAISKGCNGVCSYCIVPSVRGKEISRREKEIICEIRSLVRLGAVEVTLLGQNVNSYGPEKSSFANLIKRISDETDIKRIRFTSPHPRDVDESLIKLYGKDKKLAPHIHLPVQAGSNNVLKLMRRGYTRERYIEITDELRRVRPNISVTTDMIVGFCGETEGDFAQTIDLIETVRFDSMFAFCYSPRPGTYAATNLQDDVPMKEKRARLEKLLELQRSIQLKLNEDQVGKMKEVLVIKKDEKSSEGLTGRAEDNRLVHFSGNVGIIGTIVNVEITKASMHSLKGELGDNNGNVSKK